MDEEPHVIEVVLLARGASAAVDGGSIASGVISNRKAGIGGMELLATKKERRIRMPSTLFIKRFPRLLSRWMSRMELGAYAVDSETGACTSITLKTIVEPPRVRVCVATITLKLQSALFADCFAEALAARPCTPWPIRADNSFAYYTIAVMLESEPRILQCERYIANTLSSGTFMAALTHASRFRRPAMVLLCFHWLRRTGGETPGWTLQHPDRIINLDVSAGLLFQWNPSIGEHVWYDVQGLKEILAAERARKRRWFVPVRTRVYSHKNDCEAGCSLLNTNVSNREEQQQSQKDNETNNQQNENTNITLTNENKEKEERIESDKRKKSATATAALKRLLQQDGTLFNNESNDGFNGWGGFSDADIGLIDTSIATIESDSNLNESNVSLSNIIDNTSNQEHINDKPTPKKLAAAIAALTFNEKNETNENESLGWDAISLSTTISTNNNLESSNTISDVTSLSIADKNCSCSMKKTESSTDDIVAGVLTTPEAIISAEHVHAAVALKPYDAIAVEVANIHEEELVAGDALSLPAMEMSTTTSASTIPPGDASPLFSGPGVGWPGMFRCYVIRRRDGRGPCRVCRSPAKEWAAIVASRLGFDGDGEEKPIDPVNKENVTMSGNIKTDSTNGDPLSLAATTWAESKKLPPCCPDCGRNLANSNKHLGGVGVLPHKLVSADFSSVTVDNVNNSYTPNEAQIRIKKAFFFRGGSYAVLRRTAFDDGEEALLSKLPDYVSNAPGFVATPRPCAYHDGARPSRRDPGISVGDRDWYLPARLQAAGYMYSDSYETSMGMSAGYLDDSFESNTRIEGLDEEPTGEEGWGSVAGHKEIPSDAHIHNEPLDTIISATTTNATSPSNRSSTSSTKSTVASSTRVPLRGGALGGWLDKASRNISTTKSNEILQRSRFPRIVGESSSLLLPPPTIMQLRALRLRCPCSRALYNAPPTLVGAALVETLDGPDARGEGVMTNGNFTWGRDISYNAPTGVPTTSANNAPLASLASRLKGTGASRAGSLRPGASSLFGPPGARHVFELRREIDDTLVAIAVSTGSSGRFDFFTCSHPTAAVGAYNVSIAAAPGDAHTYLGTTRCNLLGTVITVHDWGMPVDMNAADPNAPASQRPIPRLAMMRPEGTDIGVGPVGVLLGHPCGHLPSLGQREVARILYDSNILAAAPNVMTVELRSHDDWDIMELMRSKALGHTSSGTSTTSNHLSLINDNVTLSHEALYGVPIDVATPTNGSLLSFGGRGRGTKNASNTESSITTAANYLSSIVSTATAALPTLAGPLASPNQLDARACTPTTGFALGFGGASGIGSWSGLANAAWTSLVGTSGADEANRAAAAASMANANIAARVASRGSASATESARTAAIITASSLALPGADSIAPSAVLMTRKPRWSERLDAWTMDFRGRVTRASKKNFQLVPVPLAFSKNPTEYTADHASAPALLFGKVSKDRFSLDIAPGCLGPLTAFAIALTTFASKLAVA